MFKMIGNLLMKKEKQYDRPPGYRTMLATCALLVEIGKIDGRFTQEEISTVLEVLQEKYGLQQEDARALIEEAERELENSVDLWQFASIINENYSNQEKMEIVERFWHIVFVDGKMDEYEHYIMNKLKNLLRISHDQLIEAKLKVKKSISEKKVLPE